MPDKQKTTQIVVPEALQEEVRLLRGFAILGAERTAYMFGSRSLTTDMSKASAAERKTLSEANKNIRDNLPAWVKAGSEKEYEKALKAVTDARKALSTKDKPTRDKIAPLRRAMKYIDVVAVPEAIKELANVTSDPEVKKKLVVAPSFKLSEWIGKAIEANKKKD